MVLACLSFYFLFFITILFFYLYAYFSDMYIFRHARIVFWLGIVDGKEKKGGGEGRGAEGAEVCSWGNEDVMLLFVVVAVAFLSI